jgi:hypothetical protein
LDARCNEGEQTDERGSSEAAGDVVGHGGVSIVVRDKNV